MTNGNNTLNFGIRAWRGSSGNSRYTPISLFIDLSLPFWLLLHIPGTLTWTFSPFWSLSLHRKSPLALRSVIACATSSYNLIYQPVSILDTEYLEGIKDVLIRLYIWDLNDWCWVNKHVHVNAFTLWAEKNKNGQSQTEFLFPENFSHKDYVSL